MTLQFNGLFVPGNEAEHFLATADANAFQKFFADGQAIGRNVVSLQMCESGGAALTAAVIRQKPKGASSQVLIAGTPLPWGAFHDAIASFAEQGWQPRLVATCFNAGQVMYLGVAEKGLSSKILNALPYGDFVHGFEQKCSNHGYYMGSIATCVARGDVLYAAIGVQGESSQLPDEQLNLGVDLSSFIKWASQQHGNGYRLTCVSSCAQHGTLLYSGVVRRATHAETFTGPMAFDVFRDTANKRHKTGSNLAALTVAEILPTSKVWNLSPQSSGYVDFLGGTLTLQDTGNLVLAGSVHDESTFSGDSWQLVVRIGNTEQVATAQGHLGAWISGGTDNTFSLPGQYPWCADHWSSVVNMGVSAHLSSNADQYNPNPPTPSNTMRTLSLAQQKEVGTWMYYLVDVTSGDPLSGHGIIKVKNSNSHKVIVSHGVQAINLDPEQEVTSFAGTLGGNWTVELINVPFEFAPATVSLQITVQ